MKKIIFFFALFSSNSLFTMTSSASQPHLPLPNQIQAKIHEQKLLCKLLCCSCCVTSICLAYDWGLVDTLPPPFEEAIGATYDVCLDVGNNNYC